MRWQVVNYLNLQYNLMREFDEFEQGQNTAEENQKVFVWQN